jgi:hypothetical protein
VVSEPVGSGYDALVDGHRRALAQISTQIAAAVRAMAATAGSGKNAGAASGKTAAVVVPACPSAQTSAGAGA